MGLQAEMQALTPATKPPRLRRRTITLDDGHRVGVSVCGDGVPLVMVHGIVAEGMLYARTLRRLAGLGFRVFAVDSVPAADRLLDEQPVDAAVLSDDLPDGGADQVECHLRIRNPTPCVVRTSTGPSTGGGTPPAAARLEKPFDLTTLANLLKTSDSSVPK